MSEHVHYPPGHVSNWTALLSLHKPQKFSHTHLPLDKLKGRALLKGERLFLCIMDQPHGLWPARALCGPQRDAFERDEKVKTPLWALLCCLKQLQQRKSVISVAWQAHVCVCTHRTCVVVLLGPGCYDCHCWPMISALRWCCESVPMMLLDFTACLCSTTTVWVCVCVCDRERQTEWDGAEQTPCQCDRETVLKSERSTPSSLPSLSLSVALRSSPMARYTLSLLLLLRPFPPAFSAEADALSIAASLSPSHPPRCFDCVNGRIGEGWMKADGLDGCV